MYDVAGTASTNDLVVVDIGKQTDVVGKPAIVLHAADVVEELIRCGGVRVEEAGAVTGILTRPLPLRITSDQECVIILLARLWARRRMREIYMLAERSSFVFIVHYVPSVENVVVDVPLRRS